MITCSYCGEKIDRLAFCKPSHKVMYHQQGKKIKRVYKKMVKEIKTKLCPHGNVPTLCKHSKCRGT